MTKQRSFASLTEGEINQVAEWLQHGTYDEVRDRIAKPRPEGFGLNIASPSSLASIRAEDIKKQAFRTHRKCLPRQDQATQLLDLAYLEDRCGSADLVAHHQQRLSIWTVIRVDENQAFWSQIANSAGVRGCRKVATVHVINKRGHVRIADVINHYSANSLQSDERVFASVDLSNDHALRLGTF